MCGIAGSRSRESGFDLYQQNLTRGYYSSSVVCLHNKGYLVIKTEGALKLEEVPQGADYYLFHSRGPTVETTKFDWDDNHPFSYGRFLVAHNGIIENANTLYGGDIGVDSRVIPWLIDKEYRAQSTKNVDVAIRDALSKLQGTFGLWVYDTTTREIRIVRSDITLFQYGTEFSSSNAGYLDEVKQNQIFKFAPKANLMTPSDEITLTKKPKYFIAGAPKS
jgi:glucosamine 6-phosphate synthetase-like amidotransferase/phosphosugar isomerase protein